MDIKCDVCDVEAKIWSAIDVWATVDGKNYCLKCQKKNKLGWFEKKENKNQKNKK